MGSIYMTVPGGASGSNPTQLIFDTDLEMNAGTKLQFVLRAGSNLNNVGSTNNAQATSATVSYLGPS